MSNKIYFTDKDTGKSPFWRLVYTLSLVLRYLAPTWAARKTADLLLTPQGKVVDKSDTPSEISLFKVDTEEGALQCYETGSGSIVLLTHGWAGGAYQFFPLMQKLAESGYKAISFDHPGHGHSYGKLSSGPQFVCALQSVLEQCREYSDQELAGIVAHSMGCLSTANIKPDSWNETPLCLIAPAFEFKQNMVDKIHGFGLYPKLFDELLNRVENKYGVTIDELEVGRKLPLFSHRTLILHDKSDMFCLAKHSMKFCAEHPQTKLVLSEGLGHGRIINEDNTWRHILQHIRSVSSPLSMESVD